MGLEARNHNELGNFWSHDHSVYWAGPAFHYASSEIWRQLSGTLIQVYGTPSRTDSAGADRGPKGLFLHSHEMYETTLKVGFPFLGLRAVHPQKVIVTVWCPASLL